MATINVAGNSGIIGSLRVNGALSQVQANSLISLTPATAVATPQGSGVVIGVNCGATSLGTNTVAIGNSCCSTSGPGANTGFAAVCIGTQAGELLYEQKCVCIGYLAGNDRCGANSICIGARAGQVQCPANTVVLNATGSTLSPTTAGFFVPTVTGRAAGIGVGRMGYDTTTKEIYYSMT